METARDLACAELWQASLERSLARRGRPTRSSLELFHLQPERDLGRVDVLRESAMYSQLRRSAAARRPSMALPGAGGISALALLAATTLPSLLGGRSGTVKTTRITYRADEHAAPVAKAKVAAATVSAAAQATALPGTTTAPHVSAASVPPYVAEPRTLVPPPHASRTATTREARPGTTTHAHIAAAHDATGGVASQATHAASGGAAAAARHSVSAAATPAVQSAPALHTTPAVDRAPVAVHTTKPAVHHAPVAVHTTTPAVHHAPVAVHTTTPAVHRTRVALHTTTPAVHRTPVALHTTKPAVHRAPVAVHTTAPAVHRTPVALHTTKPAVHPAPVAVHTTAPAVHTAPAKAPTHVSTGGAVEDQTTAGHAPTHSKPVAHPHPVATTHPSKPAPAPAPTVAPGRYANPLAGADVTPERIDQGVDYSGSGPLGAIGDGKITYVGTSGTGWPGAFIEFQLTDGPDAGRYVYYAEGISPVAGLMVGQTVRAGQPVAQIIAGGSSGIEIGWGAGVGTESYAMQQGQWQGGDDANSVPSPAGKDFSALIAELGGPPGKIEG